MPRHDPPDIGQPNPGAFKIFHAVQPLEDSEQLVGILHVKPHSVVTHENDEFVRVSVLATDFDLSRVSRASVLDGICQQVDKNLTEHGYVPSCPWQAAAFPDDVTSLGVSLQGLECLLHQGFQIHIVVLHRGPAHTREAQQIVDEPAHFFGRVENLAEIVPAFFVQFLARSFPHQPGKGGDMADRSAQVVGDRIAEGFQLRVGGLQLRRAYDDALFQFHVETADFFLRPLALGDVADGDHGHKRLAAWAVH